mmetsp:Transcript_44516/g.71296  ORF Transcript_44516/g.71296 Transcript_44516/m.71296 type:complete len:158 (+) Transcript_44516:78-551(+)|eukprot:CAMPEP_0197021674 /NCGR_PEP_ID=MMETSP1384-20130603/2612_1 /TAXON_ID=29189 /ORGANISM="Ammonia sp." /LENGTH=157 /DNA_ID=CAMNT_0042449559 /DNA_START=78 /DNA_END=551 /DNA_ORIENTATION=+
MSGKGGKGGKGARKGGPKGAQKAVKAQQAHKKGVRKFKRKLRYTVHFRGHRTLKQLRAPKYAKKSVQGKVTMDKYRIIRRPLTTEHAMKRIEDNNTLVFVCDVRASKPQIQRAVKELYNVETSKINTLIRPDGFKKAYVKLTPDHDALDVANRIGII